MTLDEIAALTLSDLRAVYLFRLACGIVAIVAYIGLTWRGYQWARRQTRFRRRVFWIAALITLLHWVGVLAFSSAYLVFHPPVLVALDPVPTYVQTYLAAAVAVGGVVLWRLCPRPEDG